MFFSVIIGSKGIVLLCVLSKFSTLIAGFSLTYPLDTEKKVFLRSTDYYAAIIYL